MEGVGGGRMGSWDTVYAGGVGGIGAGAAGAGLEQMAAGVSPRWNRQRASSPAALAVAAAGIVGGRWEALDRSVRRDVVRHSDAPPVNRRRMFLVLAGGRRSSADGGASADRDRTEGAVVAAGPLRTVCEGQGSGRRADKELSALRHNTGLPAPAGVAFLDILLVAYLYSGIDIVRTLRSRAEVTLILHGTLRVSDRRGSSWITVLGLTRPAVMWLSRVSH